jgi:hypothetical protein
LKAGLFLLFVCLQGKRLEERSKQGRQSSATFRGESGVGWGGVISYEGERTREESGGVRI